MNLHTVQTVRQWQTLLDTFDTLDEAGILYFGAGHDLEEAMKPVYMDIDGKPIIYSLGNFWFNSKTLDTMLIQLHYTGNNTTGRLQATVVPAVQTGGKTYYLNEAEEQQELYDYLESISVNVVIDDDGNISQAE